MSGLLPVIGDQVQGRQHLLKAGHHLALGNTYLVKGLAETEKEGLALSDRLNIFSRHLQSAIPQYHEALEQLSAVNHKILPVEYQKSFSEFKVLFAVLPYQWEGVKAILERYGFFILLIFIFVLAGWLVPIVSFVFRVIAGMGAV